MLGYVAIMQNRDMQTSLFLDMQTTLLLDMQTSLLLGVQTSLFLVNKPEGMSRGAGLSLVALLEPAFWLAAVLLLPDALLLWGCF